jgi:predicted RNA-binding Zn ribbon-like protein
MAPSWRSLALYRWSRSVIIENALHACALAIENLLIDVDRRRLKEVRASDCDVYFVDLSKGHRRQWCSMNNCGNAKSSNVGARQVGKPGQNAARP